MQENSHIPATDSDVERLVVGVDVGGTKIAAGVVDPYGQVYSRVQLPTDTDGPERTLQSIAAGIEEAILAAGIRKEQIHEVGLGIPGIVDPEHGIGLFSANLGWKNVAVTRWLEDTLRLPCVIENDVSVAALGEHLYGAGQGVHTMLYMSLGTGIAARVVINGRLHRGSHGLAGEIGHTVFVPDGPLCLCGARGCLETLASGPALARLAWEKIQAGHITLLSDLDILKRGEQLTAEHLFAAIAQGDSLSKQIVFEAGAHLAYAVYLLAMSFDPQIIVLGGGLAHEENPLIETVRSEVARWTTRSPVFQEIWAPDMLRLTALKRDAGILGAAALVSASDAIRKL
jgi:glucokinase